MQFDDEKLFEDALVKLLSESYGWSSQVLVYPTEADLLQNWADILYQNNRSIDRLDKYPLTDGEMRQILDQIATELRTPCRINEWITGQFITIKRDNPDDVAHLGKEVSLKIFDSREIAAGQSVYQIARQPRFKTPSGTASNRRGDLLLLINGMPLFHLELKKSGVPISRACNQIESYAQAGVYHGIFALVQIFVAMNPEETVYFANPGPDGVFNPDFFFHWADFNNEPINDWKDVAKYLLSIPMAHQLVGYYTIADGGDGVLKVLRSYQYYAASAIADKVAATKWADGNQYGGFIWHTTGSGKTMTSFKSAQLIATSKDADKVIFLVDRVELGTQSYQAYDNFASGDLEVQATENTDALIAKLKSPNPANTLIVTSIQKMSNIEADYYGMATRDLQQMQSKRVVFIIDECHRSTFGDMLITIKRSFPKAIFFGFTGTPIQKENQKKENTTSSVFGSELHRYSIADGIRDGNVLGFDPSMVQTFTEASVRDAVALDMAKASTVEEAMADPEKREVFLKYHDLPMAKGANGGRGIEDYIKPMQYQEPAHQEAVVKDIVDNWVTISRGRFHAIFATSSIPEAYCYYQLFKDEAPHLKVTMLVDPSLDNGKEDKHKEKWLIQVLEDYNTRYNQTFTMATYDRFKKDVANRLAHKATYRGVESEPEKQIDLLIVVDQMLTGFDSKWINALYLDKLMRYENIIQAFSRTNRLFGNDKPFGVIKYYRYPHTMKQNIKDAVRLYSGDKPLELFVDKLPQNRLKLARLFEEMAALFAAENITNFESLPSATVDRQKFAALYKEFDRTLTAAKIQGFKWDEDAMTPVNSEAEGNDAAPDADGAVMACPGLPKMPFDEVTVAALLKRYQELGRGGRGGINEELPYDLDTRLTTIATDKINAEYMDANFKKYLKLLQVEGVGAESVIQAEELLHKTFATLSQEDQKYANIFLHDIQRGDVTPAPGKTLQDYIAEYAAEAKNDRIHRFAGYFGMDEDALRNFLQQHITEENLNEYGRYDELTKHYDKAKAREYFLRLGGKPIPPHLLARTFDRFLRTFLLSGGGFDIDPPSAPEDEEIEDDSETIFASPTPPKRPRRPNLSEEYAFLTSSLLAAEKPAPKDK